MPAPVPRLQNHLQAWPGTPVLNRGAQTRLLGSGAFTPDLSPSPGLRLPIQILMCFQPLESLSFIGDNNKKCRHNCVIPFFILDIWEIRKKKRKTNW